MPPPSPVLSITRFFSCTIPLKPCLNYCELSLQTAGDEVSPIPSKPKDPAFGTGLGFRVQQLRIEQFIVERFFQKLKNMHPPKESHTIRK